jgi:DNA invertase Pin-like site-specific DNA recombinase
MNVSVTSIWLENMESTAKQKVAYSYLRFSSPEQAKGDSFRRQLDLATKFAAANDLDLDDRLSFHDLGVSAYRGVNSETGQLAVLLEAVKTGLILPGSAILVESLDRISRQSARRALRIIEGIVELGVSIVTLADGREYTLESLDRDPLNLLMAILTFIRANEESTIKSQRVAAAWEEKRKRASTALITSRCPGWMHASPDKKRFILDPERVKIIEYIFQLAGAGGTFCSIARALNTEGTPPLRSQGVQGKFWTTSSVKMILESETVRGTLTPFSCRVVNGKLRRAPLSPIPDYYPRVIDDDLFLKVQSIILMRRPKSHGSYRRVAQNVMGYITRCGYCASGMVKAYGTTGGYLICRNKFLHAGCSCESISYYEIETTFLRILMERITDGSLSKERSLHVWCSQMREALEGQNAANKAELNRILRKECLEIEVFHDLGSMEVTWKTGPVSAVSEAFTPSCGKSTRSILKAQRLAGKVT